MTTNTRRVTRRPAPGRTLFSLFLLAIAACTLSLDARAQNFGDDFNDNSINGVKWSQYSPSSQTTVKEQNSRLELAVTGPSGSAGANGLDSTTLDMTDRWVAFELVSRGGTSGYATDTTYLRIDDNNNFQVYTNSASAIYFGEKTGGTFTSTSALYSSTQMRFIRWRHVASTNTVYWETSPTGADGSWTVRRQVTPQIAITALKLRFSLFTSSSNTQPVLHVIDNVTSSFPFNPPNQPPTVSITSPSNNATFDVNSNVTLSPNASDIDGVVSKVEFFEGTNKIGESTSAPFNVTWQNVSAADYSLTAKATDNSGASTTSSPVNATVYTKLAGKVTRTDGATQISGATVKIFQDGTLKNTVTANSSGDYIFTGLTAGDYTVEASATGFVTASQSANAPAATVGTSNFNLIASNAAGIAYHYDESGRLSAVSDPATDTARYAYDAAGNLASIARASTSQASVISFRPRVGNTGTMVVIAGTGFSSTPGQNTVLFNGTAAGVISSTSSEIVTTVPAEATTGQISVTSPNGSSTSVGSFTVGNPSGAPTVGSFTPVIGSPGATLTINGTNFEPATYNNKLKVNFFLSPITSATQSSIVSKVPNGGSGRITVTTPGGTATSSADLFIPPSPYTPADVVYTGRVAVGSTQTMTINTGNKTGMMLFDGVQGQRVFLKIGPTTLGQASFILYDIKGELLYGEQSLYPAGGTSEKFVDTILLPYTGSYTVFGKSATTLPGNLPVTVYNVAPDLTSPITIGGSAVTFTATTPGQNATLYFDATAGQKISLTTSGSTLGGSVTIYNPYNGSITTGMAMSPGYEAFIDQQTLAATGRYTIVVDPGAASTGATTITLYNAADITGTITPDGSTFNPAINVPGQNVRWTFSGTTGQRVSIRTVSGTLRVYDVKLLNPDGSTLRIENVASGYEGAWMDTRTLPADGTYTVLVDGYGNKTGGLTMNLYTVPADLTGALTIGAAATPVTITTPGQNGSFTFSGTAAQQVTARVTSCNMGVTLKVLKPDGTQLSSTSSGSTSFNLGPLTLPTTGTYTVVVDPGSYATGSLNLAVTTP